MNKHDCPIEETLIVALRRGELGAELRAHATSCEICGDALAAGAYLARLADADGPEHVLPDPRVILLKNELIRNSQAPSELARRAVWSGAVVWSAVAACWIVLLSWRWSDVHEIVARANPLRVLARGGDFGSLPMISIIGLAVMALVTFAITFHQVLAEE